jgi:hypothetical protein
MTGQLSVRPSVLARFSPLTLAQISVGFALIAAVWLGVASVHGELIALVAALAVVVTGHAARVLAGPRATPAIEWGLAGSGLLTEFVIYAAIAAGVSLHKVTPHGDVLAGFGGSGAIGVWRLAVIAVVLTVLIPVVDLCVHGPALPGSRLRLFGPPGDARLPVACAALPAFGARAAFLAVLILGVAAVLASVIDGARHAADRGELRGYRGDGWISVWIGRWVDGRLPPLAALFVGLLVTGVLTALGLGNLSGILLLTPVEAMLIAALASWHPHDGRSDWLVPPLLQAGEYTFLAEIGFAAQVWPALTFALVAVVGLRHLDLAYRVRGGMAAGVDRRGLGWEGRMLIAGIAAAVGIAPVAYGALTVYLSWRVGRDWLVGWAARRAPARTEVT